MSNHLFLRAGLGFVGLLTLSFPLFAEEVDAAKASDPSKTHVLFMGADLEVAQDKKLYRVEDVDGSELKIRIGRKEFFVPTRNRTTRMKVSHGLKLSAGSVKLDGLKSGPAYTPANDPRHKFSRESGAAAGAAAVQDLAFGEMIITSLGASQAAYAAGGQSGPGAEMAQAAVKDMQLRADRSMRSAAEMSAHVQYSSQYDTGAAADRMEKELAAGNYDAMEVAFKISSPVELDDPHMIILFRFQERDAKPGEEGMLIHATSLDPIGPKPKYIRVLESGLPQGFKYVDCTVHIYNRGEEVATNASAKRVELSRDEARQYLLIEYLAAHKDATLPPAPVPGSLPSVVRSRLSAEQLNRFCYVRISKDGTLLGVFADGGASLPLGDPETVAVLADAFFKPALSQGKPVDGITRVRVADLTL